MLINNSIKTKNNYVLFYDSKVQHQTFKIVGIYLLKLVFSNNKFTLSFSTELKHRIIKHQAKFRKPNTVKYTSNKLLKEYFFIFVNDIEQTEI